MSLMTKKDQARAQASAGWRRARQTATRVTPLAKTATATAGQGVQDARDWAAHEVHDVREWAAPRIEQGVLQARGWAAPRIEHAAHTLEETVAPKVSDLLTATAHRIEPTGQAARRWWPRMLAALAMIAAAGGAVAAVVRRRAARAPDSETTDEDVAGATPEPDGSASEDPVAAETEMTANGRQARR